MKILLVVTIIIATLLVLKFAQETVKRFSKNYSILKILHQIMPLLVSVIWIVIFFWTSYYLFGDKSYYNLVNICIIVILSLLIGWFFARDFIAGVIFKVQNNFQEGDVIQVSELNGNIAQLSIAFLLLQTNDGKLVRIPYSKLSGSIISQNKGQTTNAENTLVLNIKDERKQEIIEEEIKTTLISSPWRIPNHMPSIKYLGQQSNFHQFEIKVDVQNTIHFNHIVSQLKNKYKAE